jgi:hypothetical protein
MRQNQIQEETMMNNSRDTMTQNLGELTNNAHPSLATRLYARTFAAKFDRQVEAGAVPTPGSPLAAHIDRLTSVRERENVARAFRNVLLGGPHNRIAAQLRIPVLTNHLDECRDVIDDITLRLHSPRPVNAKGMARLRMLLADGTGPLYFQGHGDLAADLHDALAAL